MIPNFNTADHTTWPVVLTPEHISAIYTRTVGAIKKACQLHKFQPAPFLTHPYRWRRADVLRQLEQGRASAHLRRAS